MKNKYLLNIIIILTVLHGCISDNSVKTIKAQGLKGVDESFNNMVFINENVGYLFGSRSGDAIWHSDSTLTREDTAIIYKTIDGGITWKSNLLGNGTISYASNNDNHLYAIKSVQDSGTTSVVYKLDSLSYQWKKYSTMKGFIKDFAFFKTTDNGKNWLELKKSYRIDNSIIKRNSILYIGSYLTDDQPYTTLFIVYDIKTQTNKVTTMPKGFRAYLMNEYMGGVYFAGLEGNSLKVYSLANEGFKEIYNINNGERNFPEKMHVFGKEIALLTGERKNLYVTNHLYLSLDKGATWKEQKLANPVYSDPIAFYDQPKTNSFLIWIYCGSGEIQRFTNSNY